MFFYLQSRVHVVWICMHGWLCHSVYVCVCLGDIYYYNPKQMRQQWTKPDECIFCDACSTQFACFYCPHFRKKGRSEDPIRVCASCYEDLRSKGRRSHETRCLLREHISFSLSLSLYIYIYIYICIEIIIDRSVEEDVESFDGAQVVAPSSDMM